MGLQDIYNAFKQSTGICTDSRSCSKGAMFVALKGDRFDGNQYVNDVLEKGAAYAIADDKGLDGTPNVFIVDDSLDTLQALANHHRKELNIPILSITGTNGKTTTKELVAAVLAKKYAVKATTGNLNNHIGVPLTLLSLTESHQLAVVEMGANHIGEIGELCRIAEPNFGLITNVGKAHLEGFGSFEGVQKAKGEMYDYMAKHNGELFINAGNHYLQAMAKGYAKRHSYGKGGTIDGKIIANTPFIEIEWGHTNGDTTNVKTQIIGDYNLENILAAITIGLHFDITPEAINEAIASYAPTNNRSQYIQTTNNQVIMDAYNANPSSMEVALKNFSLVEAENKVVVLGAMKEMGVNSDTEHQKLLDLISSLQFDDVYLIGDEFNGLSIGKATLFKSAEEAVSFFEINKLTNKYVLLKGSRSNKLEQLLPNL